MHLKKFIQGFALTRGNQYELLPFDHYVILDAGKDGNHPHISQCFQNKDSKSVEKNVHAVVHHFDENSMNDRRDKVRGTVTLNLAETALVFSKKTLKLPKVKREHFPGTNHGNVIGPIVVTSYADVWRMDVRNKRELFNKESKVVNRFQISPMWTMVLTPCMAFR